MISVLSNLTAHLERFLGAHELLFPEKVMQDFLKEVTVKTDVCRMKEHMGNRNHPVFPPLLKITSRIKSLNSLYYIISDKVLNIFFDCKIIFIIENVENKKYKPNILLSSNNHSQCYS